MSFKKINEKVYFSFWLNNYDWKFLHPKTKRRNNWCKILYNYQNKNPEKSQIEKQKYQQAQNWRNSSTRRKNSLNWKKSIQSLFQPKNRRDSLKIVWICLGFLLFVIRISCPVKKRFLSYSLPSVCLYSMNSL